MRPVAPTTATRILCLLGCISPVDHRTALPEGVAVQIGRGAAATTAPEGACPGLRFAVTMPRASRPAFLGRTSERAVIDHVLANVRGGQSAALVIRGGPGIGKTALLQYAARQASGLRVEHVTGMEAEMELPNAGIHQLCFPMLPRLDALPQPQQNGLRVGLGLASGQVPERFLVGLAVLGLLSAEAEERPLLCLVDDAQWLDAASELLLGFVARRVR